MSQGNTPHLLLHRVLLALLVSTLVLLGLLHAPTVTVAVTLARPLLAVALIVLLVNMLLPLGLRVALLVPLAITRYPYQHVLFIFIFDLPVSYYSGL